MQIALYAVALVLTNTTDTVHYGENLTAPAELVSKSGNAKLKIQTDGNLVVLEHDSKVIWSSDTAGNYEGVHLSCY